MTEQITKQSTNAELLKRLQEMAGKTLSDKEKLEQRVSFIYGSIDSNSRITKERIRSALNA